MGCGELKSVELSCASLSQKNAGCEVRINTVTPQLRRAKEARGWRRRPLQREDRKRTKCETASFIPGTVSGIFIGWDEEKAPYSTLAAIILHSIHSSSLF